HLRRQVVEGARRARPDPQGGADGILEREVLCVTRVILRAHRPGDGELRRAHVVMSTSKYTVVDGLFSVTKTRNQPRCCPPTAKGIMVCGLQPTYPRTANSSLPVSALQMTESYRSSR